MTVGRLLLTRRWVSLTLLAAMFVVLFGWLGDWQLGRTYRTSGGYVQEPAASPLDSLDPRGSALAGSVVGRQATVSGQYDPAHQRLVPGKVLDGSPVSWVVTPLTLSDGSTVEVVRGWAAHDEAGLTSPPTGTVQLTGRLEPADASVPNSPTDRAGYLVRTAQSPPDPLSLQPVPSRPVQTVSGAKEFHLQNAVYTVQWWVFAVLVIVFWWRLLRDERRDRSEAGLSTKVMSPA
jgi:cytochrome oxidase assembly protein ShyY1